MACGICQDTFYDWIKKDEEAKSGKYFEFSESIRKARADAEVRNVALVNKAAEKDARHAEWWLERTNWEKWGRKDKMNVEHSGRIDFTVFKELMKDEK